MTDNLHDETAAADRFALYEAHAKAHGLTVPQLRALEAVCAHPGCTQTALCDFLRASKQRVSLLVRELTQMGLLTVEADGEDGRRRRLRPTPAGRAVPADGSAAPAGTHTHVSADGTVFTHTHGDGRGHTHSHRHTKEVLDRLARAVGHLEKVRRMVEDGADCSEVLIQLSAVKAAVNNTGKLILKDHIEHCVVDAVEQGDDKTIEELNRAIDRFIK